MPVAAAAISEDDCVLLVGAAVFVAEEMEEEEEVDVELGFTPVTWPLTIQLPLPFSQQLVALRLLAPPSQHHD